MWSIYSKHYLRKNRAASLSILSTVFIAVVFLSFLTALFSNLWIDERARAAYEGRVWQPALLTGIYAVILLMVCAALLIMIYYAFEMTKDGRMHQLGILQSVGATPRQIRAVLMQEALVLGSLPLLPGMLPGIGLAYLFTVKANEVNRIVGNMEVTFFYGYKLFFLTALCCLLTVWLAAARAAVHLGRIGVLEAIRGGQKDVSAETSRRRADFGRKGFLRKRRMHKSIEWEMVRRFMDTRKKAFRTAFLSLTLSFSAFSLFLNVWTISSASRQITYFGKYWDTWDESRRMVEMVHEQLIERAYTMTVGGLCVLLAGIGIANIFTNMLGSIQMRKREFARYQAIGFTPKSLWRMLAMEGAFMALRPIWISLPVNILFVLWAVDISPITMRDYLRVMPVLPLGVFAAAILGATGIACYLAGKRILEADLVESLKDETMY